MATENPSKKLRSVQRDFGFSSSWSALSFDLLWEILKLLPLIDCINFSVVCKPWNSAFKEKRHPPAIELPWMMFPNAKNTQKRVNFRLIASKKIYSIPLPIDDFADRFFVQCSFGWLMTTNSRGEIHLLNPLNGKQINLPSITTFSDVCLWDSKRAEQNSRVAYQPLNDINQIVPLSYLSRSYFVKAIVIPASPSCSSTLEGGFTVVALRRSCNVAIIRNGDTNWRMVKVKRLSSKTRYFIEIAYIGGVVYTLDNNGKLFTWDIPGRKMVKISSSNLQFSSNSNAFNLVEYSDRDLLMVVRQSIAENNDGLASLKTKKMNIYLFNRDTRSWTPVRDLGDNCLFIGINDAYSCSTLKFPELNRDSIYFTHKYLLWHPKYC